MRQKPEFWVHNDKPSFLSLFSSRHGILWQELTALSDRMTENRKKSDKAYPLPRVLLWLCLKIHTDKLLKMPLLVFVNVKFAGNLIEADHKRRRLGPLGAVLLTIYHLFSLKIRLLTFAWGSFRCRIFAVHTFLTNQTSCLEYNNQPINQSLNRSLYKCTASAHNANEERMK